MILFSYITTPFFVLLLIISSVFVRSTLSSDNNEEEEETTCTNNDNNNNEMRTLLKEKFHIIHSNLLLANFNSSSSSSLSNISMSPAPAPPHAHDDGLLFYDDDKDYLSTIPYDIRMEHILSSDIELMGPACVVCIKTNGYGKQEEIYVEGFNGFTAAAAAAIPSKTPTIMVSPPKKGNEEEKETEIKNKKNIDIGNIVTPIRSISKMLVGTTYIALSELISNYYMTEGGEHQDDADIRYRHQKKYKNAAKSAIKIANLYKSEYNIEKLKLHQTKNIIKIPTLDSTLSDFLPMSSNCALGKSQLSNISMKNFMQMNTPLDNRLNSIHIMLEGMLDHAGFPNYCDMNNMNIFDCIELLCLSYPINGLRLLEEKKDQNQEQEQSSDDDDDDDDDDNNNNKKDSNNNKLLLSQVVPSKLVKPAKTARMLSNNIEDLNNNKCHDENDNCPFWMKEGECINNPSYMTVSCMKSCGTCFNNIHRCLDGKWSQSTLLSSVPVLSPEQQQSKNLVKEEDEEGEEEEEDDEDEDDDIDYIFKEHLIEAYRCDDYLNNLPLTDDDEDDNDERCKLWADAGECENKDGKGFMLVNCPKSCLKVMCVNKDDKYCSKQKDLGKLSCFDINMMTKCRKTCSEPLKNAFMCPNQSWTYVEKKRKSNSSSSSDSSSSNGSNIDDSSVKTDDDDDGYIQYGRNDTRACTYDNYSYLPIAVVVEQVTGIPLWAWVLELVAKPVGMNDMIRCMSRYKRNDDEDEQQQTNNNNNEGEGSSSNNNVESELKKGCYLNPATVEQMLNPDSWTEWTSGGPQSITWPGAGYFASARDLSKFMAVMLNNGLIEEEEEQHNNNMPIDCAEEDESCISNIISKDDDTKSINHASTKRIFSKELVTSMMYGPRGGHQFSTVQREFACQGMDYLGIGMGKCLGEYETKDLEEDSERCRVEEGVWWGWGSTYGSRLMGMHITTNNNNNNNNNQQDTTGKEGIACATIMNMDTETYLEDSEGKPVRLGSRQHYYAHEQVRFIRALFNDTKKQ